MIKSTLIDIFKLVTYVLFVLLCLYYY